MNILIIQGSPRARGCSATLAARFAEEAEIHGATTETVVLNSLRYSGCQGCMLCKGPRTSCILNDELTPVLEKMQTSDIIVLASPVYVGEISGQLKLFIDRTYSLLTPEFLTGPKRSRLAHGKKLVFILSQGAPENFHADLVERYSELMSYYEFEETRFIRTCNMNSPEDIRPELIEKTADLARTMTR